MAAQKGPKPASLQHSSGDPSLAKREAPRDGNDSDSRPGTSLTNAGGSSGLVDSGTKALQRRTGQLEKEFEEKQRAAVVQLISTNRDVLLQSLQHKSELITWPEEVVKKSKWHNPVESKPPPDELKNLAKVKAKYKVREQGMLYFSLKRLAKQGGVPPYKSWSYLMRNEQANETGGRVFYTDSTGETIPASDSEDDDKGIEGSLEGAGRERSMWVMQRLAQEAGSGPDVIAVLAKRFGASKGAVAARLKAIQTGKSAEAAMAELPVPHTDFGHELDKAVGSFCRRCRIYNCVTHSGPHVRPVKKQLQLVDADREPCSAVCWRRDPRFLSLAAPAEPAAAADAAEASAPPQAPEQAASQAPSQPEQSASAAAAPAAAVPARDCAAPARSSSTRPTSAAKGKAAAVGATSPPAQQKAPAPDKAPQQLAPGGIKQGLAAAPARRRSPRPATGAVDLCPSDSDSAVQSPRAARSVVEISSGARDGVWSEYELSLLKYGMEMFQGDPCRIARIVASKPCAEVCARMRALEPSLPLAMPGDPALGARKPSPAKRKLNAPTRRNNATKVVQKRHKHDSGKPWPAYNPCSCVGGCDNSCPCLVSKNFCEKFCGCSATCSIRFVGCQCTSGCRSKLCPCFAAGHECDTDLCKGCTKSLLGKVEAGPGCAAKCCNMRLRFRQHKRIAMGLSNVAGWGSFLLEMAYKGDLLGEYTGELVNQQEADRRGKAYDRDDNSYLFNLNEDWVIDARRRGNKLRFANHSTDPNCMAKILMVDGDHRVGIYARKDIPAGTELTYDYCYSIEQAPSWARARRQSKKAAEPVAAQAQKLATG